MPGCRRIRHHGALLAQDGDRADRVDLDHLRRNSSPGIEPIAANVYLQKTLSGSFTVRNRHLQKLLAEKGHGHRRGLVLDHARARAACSISTS